MKINKKVKSTLSMQRVRGSYLRPCLQVPNYFYVFTVITSILYIVFCTHIVLNELYARRIQNMHVYVYYVFRIKNTLIQEVSKVIYYFRMLFFNAPTKAQHSCTSNFYRNVAAQGWDSIRTRHYNCTWLSQNTHSPPFQLCKSIPQPTLEHFIGPTMGEQLMRRNSHPHTTLHLDPG